MRTCICTLVMILGSISWGQVPESLSDADTPDTLQLTVEMSFIELGDEPQYVELRGTSPENPVLLFLHGGPGWPQTPYLRYFNTLLPAAVNLVAWEQSGCGKSFLNNPNPKKLSLEQIIADAHELTQILKERFKQERIYLAGFSWGSVIGLHLADRYPEDYVAYIGISQVIDLKRGMQLSREWLKEQARKNGDGRTLHILDQIENRDTTIGRTDLDFFLAQFEQLNKYGGSIYAREVEEQIEKVLTMYDDYQGYDWMGGFAYSASRLDADLFAIDLTGIQELKIPAYFITGRHDRNVPTEIIAEYVTRLKAPKKEIVWFENSGHEPLEEEARRFDEEIIRIVNEP